MCDQEGRHVEKTVRPLPVDLSDPADQWRYVVGEMDHSLLADREALEHFTPEGDIELSLPKRACTQGSVVPDEVG